MILRGETSSESEHITQTIENPANKSFTKIDILIGSSKLPRVTAFTARRDYDENIVSEDTFIPAMTIANVPAEA